MTREEINAAAQAAFADARGSGPWLRVNCVFCPEVAGKEDRGGALHFHRDDGWFTCHRCKTKGRLPGFDDGTPWRAPRAQQPTGPVNIKPPEFIPLASERARTSVALEPARAYLTKRGLGDPRVWEQAQVGACLTGRFSGRVIVPVLEDDRWVWFTARTWGKGPAKKYLGPSGQRPGIMYNAAALSVETDRPALIVEGIFDALPYWPDAVAVLGKPTPAQIAVMLEARRPVVVVLDGDAPGEAEALCQLLRFDGADRGLRAGWVKLPTKVDPDEVNKEWLLGQCWLSLDQP